MPLCRERPLGQQLPKLLARGHPLFLFLARANEIFLQFLAKLRVHAIFDDSDFAPPPRCRLVIFSGHVSAPVGE